MSSISQQGGDSETARAIARPPFLFLVALLLGFVSDHLLPLPFPISRIGLAHWISAGVAGSLIFIGIESLCRRHSQLLQRRDPSSGDQAHPSAGYDRNSRLEPQSHLSRHVSHLRWHRHSRAQPVDPDPSAASRHHDALRRGRARGGLSRAAFRRRLPRLQGACAPLAVAVEQRCEPAHGPLARGPAISVMRSPQKHAPPSPARSTRASDSRLSAIPSSAARDPGRTVCHRPLRRGQRHAPWGVSRPAFPA